MAQDHMCGEQQSKYLNTECATLKTKFSMATQQCLLNKEELVKSGPESGKNVRYVISVTWI